MNNRCFNTVLNLFLTYFGNNVKYVVLVAIQSTDTKFDYKIDSNRKEIISKTGVIVNGKKQSKKNTSR